MEDDFEVQEWYVLKDNKENEGPLSKRDIDALYKTMVIRSSSLVWKDGMEEWKPIYQVEDLNKLINQAVAEAENIPDIQDEVEHKEADKTEELKKQVSTEQVEKLASQAIEHFESEQVQSLLDRPDEELNEEEKELKQKEREKLLRKEKKKRYRKNRAKKKWYNAKVNTNIYISGLPKDITHEELEEHFSKCGAIRMDPNTGQRKIKIYEDDDGTRKGDGLISFEKIESVETAIEMLDESNIRPDFKISVQNAQFEQKGDEYRERKRAKIDEVEKKRIQAENERRFAWNEEQANSIGLKIVILKHLFTPAEVKGNDQLLKEIEIDVKTEIDQTWGNLKQIEMFPEHPDGVIKVKFDTPMSAEKWVEIMNGRAFDGRTVSAEFWDGKTNFNKVSESDLELQGRVNEFGDWLNEQELPEELKVKKEADLKTE